MGAQPPETNGIASREALRLKGRLVGSKKRGREEDEGAKATAPSEDEDESRAGSIKKKPRLDPFERTSKKKKQKVLASTSQKTSEPGPSAVPDLSVKQNVSVQPEPP